MNIPDLNNSTDGRGVFKTPRGYFDSLDRRIMQRVLEDDNPAGGRRTVRFWQTEAYARLKPYIYMAAMFGGLYFGVWVYKYQQRILSEKSVTAQLSEGNVRADGEASEEEIYSYVNDACDYMMTDSHDIVACLTGSE